ncbi:3-deoxy-manno-octulosonate cytidylyltransferase [Butyrivibrio sp. NC2007]|uniref:3-deoxy-manno-octulosonate cytidylyltransferase n=1 Tax=Butyrivibrio sp. NC2007 TaxID=1280683 RepID=UPI0003B61AFC|nr:3-deoxy-manno-octulosonate cytidylyltransferase [Butyrivibrio sp. NC2007]
MKIIGVIPSRYKSSRFPGKPLASINGKPMIWWVYQQAMKAKGIDELVVATDDERIYKTCEEYEMNVMMTSDDIVTGADRVAEVAEKTDGDIYLNIQGDEPLIQPEAIEQVIDVIVKDESVYYLGLRTSIDSQEEWLKPNTVKAVTDSDGNALYFSRSPIPYNDYTKSYRVLGIYGYRRDFLIAFKKLGLSPLEKAEKGVEMLRAMQAGYKVKLIDTTYHTIGVDLPEHIKLVEDKMKELNW